MDHFHIAKCLVHDSFHTAFYVKFLEITVYLITMTIINTADKQIWLRVSLSKAEDAQKFPTQKIIRLLSSFD